MSFLRNTFGHKQAPSKPVSEGRTSPQLAFLKAKADEKLTYLRYLASCGPMDATKLEADLSMKERALARLQPIETTAARYRPPDQLMLFLRSL